MGFITGDSGQRESFPSGMVRDVRHGKGRFDLVTPIGLRRLAQVYERGAAKYDDRNWEKGSPLSRFIDSAERHINDYKCGLRDEDHLAQASWNLFAVMHLEATRPELQDMPTYFATWSDADDEGRVQPEAAAAEPESYPSFAPTTTSDAGNIGLIDAPSLLPASPSGSWKQLSSMLFGDKTTKSQ